MAAGTIGVNTIEVLGIDANRHTNQVQNYAAGAVVVLSLSTQAQAQTGSPRTNSLLALPFITPVGFPVAPWADFPVTV